MPGRQEQELLVITKMYELVVWSANHIVKFPREHRFILGDRLPLLREINLELELLRFQFRLAKDLKCLSVESYGSTRFTRLCPTNTPGGKHLQKTAGIKPGISPRTTARGF